MPDGEPSKSGIVWNRLPGFRRKTIIEQSVGANDDTGYSPFWSGYSTSGSIYL